MEAGIVQVVAVQTVVVVGIMVTMPGIIQLQLRGLESRLREDMRQNHLELKNLIIGHFHPDNGEAAFRLPQTTGD